MYILFIFTNFLHLFLLLFYFSMMAQCHLRRFELRGLLVLWNSALALFSIMGAMRTAPELIHVLLKFGLFHSVCNQRLVLLWHGPSPSPFAFSSSSSFVDLLMTSTFDQNDNRNKYVCVINGNWKLDIHLFLYPLVILHMNSVTMCTCR